MFYIYGEYESPWRGEMTIKKTSKKKIHLTWTGKKLLKCNFGEKDLRGRFYFYFLHQNQLNKIRLDEVPKLSLQFQYRTLTGLIIANTLLLFQFAF